MKGVVRGGGASRFDGHAGGRRLADGMCRPPPRVVSDQTSTLMSTAIGRYVRYARAGQRTRSRALQAVVVPAALEAVALQLAVRRMLALPAGSVVLTPLCAMPSTRHA
jgi:hypothetical protein